MQGRRLAQTRDNADRQIITLGDISDLVVRKKVADLIAVTPALPVADLYGLLVDLKRDLLTVKRQLIRASQALLARASIKPKTLSAAAWPQNYS